MAWPYPQIKTAVTGDILTATDYNNEHQNHITNNDPGSINDDSPTVTEMKVTVDPGESGTESLATTLTGEIQRLRFAIVDMKGTSFWYQTPTKTLAQMLPLSGGTVTGAITMSGAGIAMGSQKITAIASATAATDVPAYSQIPLLQFTGPTYVTTQTTNNTNSYTDATGVSVAITPILSTSHVLVEANLSGRCSTTGSDVGLVDVAITDSSNTILQEYIGAAGPDQTGAINFYFTIRVSAWDAPGSTSAKTYKVRFRRNTNATGTTITINTTGIGQRSSIQATEYR